VGAWYVRSIRSVVVSFTSRAPVAAHAGRYPRAHRQQPAAGAGQDRQYLLQRQRADVGDHAASP
jgi:hypothetical protein